MDATTGGSRELADYLAMLRRRWWVVAAASAMGVAIAALLVVVMPKTYSSFAVVNVLPTKIDTASQSGRQQDVNLQTEAQRIKSYHVAERVARDIKTDESAADLSQSVSVTVPNDSTILYITVDAPTAAAARDRAHAFAQAYLDDRRDGATGVLMQQMSALQRQINALSKQLLATNEKVQKDLIVAQMRSLNDKASDLRVQAANVNPGDIITDARLPLAPSDPTLTKYLPSGLVGGLLLGVVLAIWLDRTDKRVRTAADLERVLDIPVLLEIPAKRGGEGLGLLPARSRAGQSFHELAHSLAATLGHGNHVLLVTGAAPGRGGSLVATNLAAALARTGSAVLLICADLQSSVAGELLGLREGPGLSELLLGWKDPREVMRRSNAAPTLRAITVGTNTESAAELLQREQMARLVTSLRERVRFTIIEAPSPELGADAQALADLADVALVVVEAPHARYTQVRDGVRRIDRMGAAVIGAAVLPVQDESVPVAPPPPPLPTRTDRPVHRERDASPSVTRNEYPVLEEAPTLLDMRSDDVAQAASARRARHRAEPHPPAETPDEPAPSGDADNSSEETAAHKIPWT